MLDDSNTYQKLDRDPAPTRERKMNNKSLYTSRLRELPQAVYNRLQSTAGHTPSLYGLSKIHKEGVPFQPIVSFIGSPTYDLSKHLSKLLSPLVGTSLSAVRNSRDFVDFISTQTSEDDECLASFDVVSLLTNVPISLAVSVACQRLEVRQIKHWMTGQV